MSASTSRELRCWAPPELRVLALSSRAAVRTAQRAHRDSSPWATLRRAPSAPQTRTAREEGHRARTVRRDRTRCLAPAHATRARQARRTMCRWQSVRGARRVSSRWLARLAAQRVRRDSTTRCQCRLTASCVVPATSRLVDPYPAVSCEKFHFDVTPTGAGLRLE